MASATETAKTKEMVIKDYEQKIREYYEVIEGGKVEMEEMRDRIGEVEREKEEMRHRIREVEREKEGLII